MATTVIDTADWSLVVPLKPALNLTGSRLTAAMTGQFGGAPAAEIDSDAGSITWTADPTTGLTGALTISVPKVARGAWSAIGANSLPRPVTLFFDVHRTVAGSTKDEWLGRSSVLILPGTDSAAVTAQASGFQPVLVAAQPCSGAVLPALQTGPQGPGLALPANFDPVADAGKIFGVQIVNGVMTLVALPG